MLEKLKARLYFLVASYFAFWARILLHRWQPVIILVTGSSGKTTLFHLLEAQLSKQCLFAHEANSSFGIPFYLLGLKRKTLTLSEWPYLFFAAPFGAWRSLPNKKYLVIEADADRPGEGKFIAALLKPTYTFLVSIGPTHSMRFDKVVRAGKYQHTQAAIIAEFSQFLVATQKQAYVSGDSKTVKQALAHLSQTQKNKVIKLWQADYLTDYQLATKSTTFVINKHTYYLPYLLPPVIALSLAMTEQAVAIFGIKLDTAYKKLNLPPGRSSLLAGIKNTTLIDSSYNANLDSMKAMIDLFALYPAKKKWLIIGHMLEQGSASKKQHQHLAKLLLDFPDKKATILLIGEGNKLYTLPFLQKHRQRDYHFFSHPREIIAYAQNHLQGGEAILLKGAPFMEGVVEALLADKKQAEQLVRREKAHQRHRQKLYEQYAP